MVVIIVLLGLLSYVGVLAHNWGPSNEDTGTRGTERVKVDGTQVSSRAGALQSNPDLINDLLKMRESMEVELEEANEEYADCEFDPIAYPEVRYAEGQLDGFKRAVALLKITLPGP